MKYLFEEYKIDALLINHIANRYYFTGFNGSAGVVIVMKDGSTTLFVDPRYKTRAKNEAHKSVSVVDFSWDKIKEFLKRNKIKTVGVDGKNMTLDQLIKVKNAGVKAINCDYSWVRLVKKDAELKNIKTAVAIGDKVFTHILKFIKIGMSETEIAHEMFNKGLSLGATGWAFDPIIASGPNSAIPHHSSGSRKVKNNEFIKLDFGFVYNGYSADMTRTIQVGAASPKLVEIYEVVRRAQEAVIKKGKPGMTCAEVETIARDVLIEAGMNKYMTHGLGHGLGIEVHEAPFFSTHKDFKFIEGSVFTNEPGVYIEGLGGVRIEDDLLVTKTGFKRLNKSPKNLITIKG